jgi:hypothetical protein
MESQKNACERAVLQCSLFISVPGTNLSTELDEKKGFRWQRARINELVLLAFAIISLYHVQLH